MIVAIEPELNNVVDSATKARLLLDEVGSPNYLHTIPGGSHGGFTLEENLENMRVIRGFLQRVGVITTDATTTSGR